MNIRKARFRELIELDADVFLHLKREAGPDYASVFARNPIRIRHAVSPQPDRG